MGWNALGQLVQMSGVFKCQVMIGREANPTRLSLIRHIFAGRFLKGGAMGRSG